MWTIIDTIREMIEFAFGWSVNEYGFRTVMTVLIIGGLLAAWNLLRSGLLIATGLGIAAIVFLGEPAIRIVQAWFNEFAP